MREWSMCAWDALVPGAGGHVTARTFPPLILNGRSSYLCDIQKCSSRTLSIVALVGAIYWCDDRGSMQQHQSLAGPRTELKRRNVNVTVARDIQEIPLFEKVVRELKRIDRLSGFARANKIGELIIGRFFDGDIQAWHDPKRNKRNSIRRLAQRSDCPLGKTALWEAVGVYIALPKLPLALRSANLTVSHVAAVLRLDQSERERFLELAHDNAWDVRTLRERVVAARRAHGERRGRPAQNLAQRALGELRRTVCQVVTVTLQVSAIGATDAETAARGLQILSDLEAACTRLRAVLVDARESKGLRETSDYA